MNRPRLLLADDHRIVVEGLRSILSSEYELVGIVEDGRELVDAAKRLEPDVIVADIAMPQLNGLDAVAQLRKEGCQAAGTPEEYAAQATALVASAPARVTDTEWLPLGTFALTREGVNDSQAMLELAVNKQGVVAGTYYNEATQVSRSLKGMLDQASQRAAIGFADGKNSDVVLETGIQNLTQDEAPALLHQGKDRSGPVLLVRLQAPEEEQK